MSGTVTGLDLDRLEELAARYPVLCPHGQTEAHDFQAPPPIVGADIWHCPGPAAADASFIAAVRNAVPSLLAAARANARIEAMVAVWEADEREYLMRFGQHIPCSLATLSEAVRAALGTEQEGRG